MPQMKWKSHCHETAGVLSLQMVFFTFLNHDFKRSGEWQIKKGQKADGPQVEYVYLVLI